MIAAHPPFLNRAECRPTGPIAPVSWLVAALVFTASTLAAARPSPVELTDGARAALPPGWTLTPAAAPGNPAGWQSLDATAGIVVQISDGRSSRTVGLVPLDWVGVQTRNGAVDLVRRAPNAKVILPAAQAEDFAWLAAFAPESASLNASAGSTADYAGQYPRVEAEIRSLLRKSGVSREQAVHAFIALGVPAEDLIREAALDSRNSARVSAVKALRHFPGKDTRAALLKILGDRSRDASASRARLAALETCEALMLDTHGPALAAALQVEKDETAVARLANGINRIRYAAAAPELRRWLKSAPAPETKIACARALATLRDTASAAEIRAVLDAPPPRRASVAAPLNGALRRQLMTELHRLVGTWGPDSAGMRLSVVVESPDRVLVYVENMGPGPLRYIPHPVDGREAWPVGLEITLDGAAISPPGPRDADLGVPATSARAIAPGSAACFELQLPQGGAMAGDHRVAAGWFGLVANDVILRSGAVVSAQDAPPAS